ALCDTALLSGPTAAQRCYAAMDSLCVQHQTACERDRVTKQHVSDYASPASLCACSRHQKIAAPGLATRVAERKR
ncbi:hypothetical protein M422DRAFT_36917, partial [Sphaerobolus stellatus SS14]